MKKRFSLILALIVIAALLASCASGSYKSAESTGYAYPTEPSYAPEPEAQYDYDYGYSENGYESVDMPEGFTATSGTSANTDFAEKMIYSASVTLETTEFEKTLDSLNALISSYGGFIESSYVTGQSYSLKWNNYDPLRSAEYVIRVPSTGFKSMINDFSGIGNVTEQRDWAENITEQFYDSQSRLNTLKVEEERLLAMLEKADNVTDMIDLEARLSEVRYNIESVTSRLRNWQNQVDYSTVTVNITEVKELTTIVEPQRTYWEEIGDGLAASLRGVWSFLKGAFKWLIVALPVLAILGVIAVITIVIIKFATRSSRKKRKAAAEAMSQNREQNEANGK
ncbi:MAG: DUF4349 domain-containing protein [Oscillospiraceae bacterium]|nr:DUF4349 domain-containing protein [Oscillospiraceae bacterium]